MERNVRIVYEDSGITKVVTGRVIEEQEFIYIIEAFGSKKEISIGKRAIVQVMPVD